MNPTTRTISRTPPKNPNPKASSRRPPGYKRCRNYDYTDADDEGDKNEDSEVSAGSVHPVMTRAALVLGAPSFLLIPFCVSLTVVCGYGCGVQRRGQERARGGPSHALPSIRFWGYQTGIVTAQSEVVQIAIIGGIPGPTPTRYLWSLGCGAQPVVRYLSGINLIRRKLYKYEHPICGGSVRRLRRLRRKGLVKVLTHPSRRHRHGLHVLIYTFTMRMMTFTLKDLPSSAVPSRKNCCFRSTVNPYGQVAHLQDYWDVNGLE
ncbi:hypothetical protein B0H16DRAFT_1473112 [Mycena metata]|uniref:Uncharacterized protein n=1 Tax=Mycena metata TaxID=1033252 RepID=A0AAD7MLP2_9AGAR|nr:hypothetical protein B0H16DRAFT_1473112 [Mycena metata]